MRHIVSSTVCVIDWRQHTRMTPIEVRASPTVYPRRVYSISLRPKCPITLLHERHLTGSRGISISYICVDDSACDILINKKMIRLNPYLDQVPVYLQGYRHPVHKHYLYINIIRDDSIMCDNVNCTLQTIRKNMVTFHCPVCDFDLCSDCFVFDTSDDDLRVSMETTMFDTRVFPRYCVEVEQLEIEEPDVEVDTSSSSSQFTSDSTNG